jgi:hypothetical protein
MEIQALRLLITEQDLLTLATRDGPADLPVRDLGLRITPDGVHLSGVYPTSFLEVPFTTLWHLSLRGGRIAAHLGSIQTGNGAGDLALDVFSLISPGAVRGTLMNAIAGAINGEDAFCVEGETVFLDAECLAAQNGWQVRLNLIAVHCGEGAIIIESGS